jgi:hypothetical protein
LSGRQCGETNKFTVCSPDGKPASPAGDGGISIDIVYEVEKNITFAIEDKKNTF